MAFPRGFESRIREIYGNYADTVLGWYSAERVSSFRVNMLLSSESEVLSELRGRGLHPEPFMSIPNAFTLPSSEEYSLKWSDAFYKWKIYVQSLSSQCPPIVLAQSFWVGGDSSAELYPVSALRILDATAAPGGKTTQLAALFNDSARIDACERMPIRFDRMAHNVRLQWADPYVDLHRVDVMALHKLFADETFDAILLDAPCSADGRFRPDDERTYAYWNSSVPVKRAKTQMEMLQEIFSLLKVGWILVYSTCTLAPEENEAIVSALLKSDLFEILPVEMDFPQAHGGVLSFGGTDFDRGVSQTLRIAPSAWSEGFFVAKLRKRKK